jgi:hypothetical protein
MTDLAGPWNVATRGPCLDIASFDAENQFGDLDRAAFGGSHAALDFGRLLFACCFGVDHRQFSLQ